MDCGLILLALCTLVALSRGQTVYRYGNGEMLIRDGIVNLEGFPGTVFQVINYLPVCGTLSTSVTKQSDLSDKCTAAMSTFNTSSATAAIYDLSGVESSDLPGGGAQLCVCGALGTSNVQSGDPKTNGLLCVWVDEKGFEEEWWSLSTEKRVASSFQQSSQGKSLPRCNEIDLASISKESVATRSVDASSTASRANPTNSATPTKGGSASTGAGAPNSTGTAVNSSGDSGGSGLSIGAIVGIVILVMLGISAAFLLWFFRCCQRPRPRSPEGFYDSEERRLREEEDWKNGESQRPPPPAFLNCRDSVMMGSSVVGTSRNGAKITKWLAGM